MPKHARLFSWRQVVRLYEGGCLFFWLNPLVFFELSSFFGKETRNSLAIEDLTAVGHSDSLEFDRDCGKTVDPEVRMAVITHDTSPPNMNGRDLLICKSAAQDGLSCARFFVRSTLTRFADRQALSHGRCSVEDHNQLLQDANGKGKNLSQSYRCPERAIRHETTI